MAPAYSQTAETLSAIKAHNHRAIITKQIN